MKLLNLKWKMDFVLFVTVLVLILGLAQSYVSKHRSMGAAKMSWQDGIINIEDFDSIPEESSQESLLQVFEELSPEIQDSILYFYDQNIALTQTNTALSFVIDELLQYFPLQVIVVEPPLLPPLPPAAYKNKLSYFNKLPPYQQQSFGYPPFENYAQRWPQQFPQLSPSYDHGKPFGFGNFGFGQLAERDKSLEFSRAKTVFPLYKRSWGRRSAGDLGDLEIVTITYNPIPHDYTVQEFVLLFLLQECTEYYEKNKSWLPQCVRFFTLILDAVDKEKLGESVERVKARRALHPESQSTPTKKNA